MNSRILLSLTIVAVAKSDAPKELSKAAQKQIEDFKAIGDAYNNGRDAILKKHTKEDIAEVKKVNAEQNKAAEAKKKGVEVTAPPARLTKAGWELKNALDKLWKLREKKLADFKKNADPKVTQEIKDYNAAAKASKAGKPAGKPAAKTTPKPAGKAKKQ